MFVAMALIGLTVLMSTTIPEKKTAKAEKRTSVMVKAEIDSKIPDSVMVKAEPLRPLFQEYMDLLEQEQLEYELKHGGQHGPNPSPAEMMEIGWCWAQACNACGYWEYDISIVCWVCSNKCSMCGSHDVECMVGSQWICDYLDPH